MTLTPFNVQDVLVFSKRHLIAEGMQPLGIFLGVMALLFFMARSRKEIAWEARSLWFFATSSALYLLTFPSLPYGDYQRAFQATAGVSAVMLLAIPLTVISLSASRVQSLLRNFQWVMWIETLCILSRTSGLLIAPTFDLAFIALYVPFARGYLKFLIIATVLMHRGSTAKLVLLAMLFAWALQNFRLRYALLPFTVAIPLILGIALKQAQSPMLDGGERLNNWFVMLQFWRQNWWYIVKGTGQGSEQWINYALSNYRYSHMHNDWLQILVELGIVGLILALFTFFIAVKNTWRDPALLPAVFGSAAFMCTYAPLRFFPSAFFLMLVLVQAIKKPQDFNPEAPTSTEDINYKIR